MNSAFDFETKSSYYISVKSTDFAGATKVKQFNVFIKDTLDTPNDLMINNSLIPENSPQVTFIGKLITVDENLPGPNTYFYTFVNGTNDNSSFLISNDSLFSNEVFDFGIKNNYVVKVKTELVNPVFLEKTLNITVTDAIDTIQDILLSNETFNENNSNIIDIGDFSCTSQDSDATYSYALVAGTGDTDNGSFSIAGNVLRFTEIADYETKNSYSIRIQATDELSRPFYKTFVIQVVDGNDSPENITLSVNTVNENLPINASIGSFSTTDQDTGDTFSYSFDNSVLNSNDHFILLSTGSLLTKESYDFETKDSYLISIKSTDNGGLSYVKQFTIQILDVNDPPTQLYADSLSAEENLPVGTVCGVFSTNDPDAGDVITYTLVAGSGSIDNASFSIVGNQLLSAVMFDFETQSQYSIRVRGTDQAGMFVEASFTIGVNNGLDSISDILLSNAIFQEKNTSNVNIGNLSCDSDDGLSNYVFELVAGTGDMDNPVFSIGADVLIFTGIADFETQSSYSIRIRATDDLNRSFEKIFVVSVSDINDNPTNIVLNNNAIAENLQANSQIGTFSTVDQDVGDVFTYVFDNSVLNNNSSFILLSGGFLLTDETFNYEVADSFRICIKSTDMAGASIVRQFTINIVDANDAPTALNADSLFIAENLSIGTPCGVLSTDDVDAGDFAVYSLVAGQGSADNASFTISGNHILSAVSYDFETKDSYAIRVRTTDIGGLYLDKTLVIDIQDGIDTIQDILLSSTTINENNTGIVSVGALSCVSQDNTGVYTYQLVAGTGDDDNSSFSINSNTLKFTGSADFEQQSSYSVRVRATDILSRSTEVVFLISVNDLNDVPLDISISEDQFTENNPAGVVVGVFSTTDEDNGDSFTYMFDNSMINDNASFTLLTSGSLLFNTVANYEVKNSYIISIKSVDSGSISYIKQFTISVLDANDAPTAINADSLVLAENLPVGTTCGVLSTDDVDMGDNAVYSLVAGQGAADNASFAISGNHVFSADSFDYEAKSSYNIRIRTTDLGGLFYERSLTIEIDDALDTIQDILLSNNQLNENNEGNVQIGTFSCLNQDSDNNQWYSLVSGNGSQDNSSFSISGNGLIFTNQADYELQDEYFVRIQATDTLNRNFQKEFTVVVLDTPDQPTDILLDNNLVT